VGDKVWLHLQKERLTGPHQKLCPLFYGPYTITKVFGENAFELNISFPFLGLQCLSVFPFFVTSLSFSLIKASQNFSRKGF
jgi:hypothetical protein